MTGRAAADSVTFAPRRSSAPTSQVSHETSPSACRCPGRTHHLLRPGTRVHRLRPGCPSQPADGAVWRLHHLHPDGIVRRPARHGVRRRGVDGRGDSRPGGAAGGAVPARHRAAGRGDHARVRPAAPGQAGAHGAVPGDARLRQWPGHRHRPGPAGALQGRRDLAGRHAALPDAGPCGADHGHRLPDAAPDPCRAAGAGGDTGRRPAGLPARYSDPHPGRHGAYRRRSARPGTARGALEPGNPAHHRPLRRADGPGRPAGNPADVEPHR
ncbi:hypothetical protein D9M70_428350 [compost metagenome]